MQLVFATNNLNKLKEVQQLVPQGVKLLSLSDINCYEEIPETQNSIEGNAIQKVNFIKEHYGYDCFADDTGLEVEALHGEPGVYSARYAGAQCNAEDNIKKMLKALKDRSNRKARFKTVIALHFDGNLHTFTGICNGDITETKQGSNGFGYDPVFKPNGYKETFAEMDLTVKNKISHRAKAFQLLVSFLNS